MRSARSGEPARRIGITGVVDERAVIQVRLLLARRRAEGGGRVVLDLGRIAGWTCPGVEGLAALLDDPGADVDLVPPHAGTFVELLRATDLRETWSVYRHVRRVMAAARARRGLGQAS